MSELAYRKADLVLAAAAIGTNSLDVVADAAALPVSPVSGDLAVLLDATTKETMVQEYTSAWAVSGTAGRYCSVDINPTSDVANANVSNTCTPQTYSAWIAGRSTDQLSITRRLQESDGTPINSNDLAITFNSAALAAESVEITETVPIDDVPTTTISTNANRHVGDRPSYNVTLTIVVADDTVDLAAGGAGSTLEVTFKTGYVFSATGFATNISGNLAFEVGQRIDYTFTITGAVTWTGFDALITSDAPKQLVVIYGPGKTQWAENGVFHASRTISANTASPEGSVSEEFMVQEGWTKAPTS